METVWRSYLHISRTKSCYVSYGCRRHLWSCCWGKIQFHQTLPNLRLINLRTWDGLSSVSIDLWTHCSISWARRCLQPTPSRETLMLIFIASRFSISIHSSVVFCFVAYFFCWTTHWTHPKIGKVNRSNDSGLILAFCEISCRTWYHVRCATLIKTMA